MESTHVHSRDVHGPKIFGPVRPTISRTFRSPAHGLLRPGPARSPATTAQSNKVVYEAWLVCISCLLVGTEKW